MDIEDKDVDTSDNLKSVATELPLDTDDVISNSQSNVKASQEEEEEFIIEDYDD